tara:strand:+ start:4116 stop:5417 length:1302 start_codon:yes stop_codon:yes gene_type:complete
MNFFIKLCFFFFIIVACSNDQNSNINSNRLNEIDNLINSFIDDNQIPGAVVLVGDNKNILYQKSFGIKNPITNDKYQINDIFRIASMTKAITSVGVIKLWEKGKIGLDDPIEKYIPEFKNVQILDSYNKKDTTYSTIQASKSITIRQLLTHTSGIGYDFIDGNPSIKSIYHKEKEKFMKYGVLCFCDQDITIGETIRNLAKVPLHHNPGERYTYGVGLDVLGYLIEIISGKTLDKYFYDEIFQPLEMNDTYFYLPENKYDRLVPVLTKKNKKWVMFEDKRFNINYPIEGAKKFFAGGCGLSSTISDYYKFLTVFLNEGKYNDNQIISKKTNELIFENQLPGIENFYLLNYDKGNLKTESFPLGHGLAFGIIRDEDLRFGGRGSKGSLYWGGYYNTSYFADPKENVIGLIFKQTQNIQDNSSELFQRIVFNLVE